MMIEMSRALKYHLMPFVLRKVQVEQGLIREEAELLTFLQEMCKNEFLKNDEFKHYQGGIETLNMNDKRSSSHTDEYLKRSINDIEGQLNKAVAALLEHDEI